MAEIAALLSFAAVKNNDRVGAFFTDRQSVHAAQGRRPRARDHARRSRSSRREPARTSARPEERGGPPETAFRRLSPLRTSWHRVTRRRSRRSTSGTTSSRSRSPTRASEIPAADSCGCATPRPEDARLRRIRPGVPPGALGLRPATLPGPPILRAAGIDSIPLRTDSSYELPLVRFFQGAREARRLGDEAVLQPSRGVCFSQRVSARFSSEWRRGPPCGTAAR